ncbi:MAG: RDD family protein [Prosthecobacter sp.]|nr:RDD family protein [Prosthecobacter sp.]
MKYNVARDGQQVGVFLEYEIRAKIQSGELLTSDLYWTEGMADWQSLGSAGHLTGAVNPYAPPSVDVSRPMEVGGARIELAGLGERLGAVMLESLVAIVCVIPLGIGIAIMDEPNANTMLGGGLAAVGGLALLALMIYNLVLLATKGQTIGKKWLNIRIADFETNGNPGFVKAFLLRSFVNGVIGAIPLVGPLYSITDICFIFRDDRRCIHDLIAGTHVVKGTLP